MKKGQLLQKKTNDDWSDLIHGKTGNRVVVECGTGDVLSEILCQNYPELEGRFRCVEVECE